MHFRSGPHVELMVEAPDTLPADLLHQFPLQLMMYCRWVVPQTTDPGSVYARMNVLSVRVELFVVAHSQNHTICCPNFCLASYGNVAQMICNVPVGPAYFS